MADKSIFGRLKKLFSSNVVVRNVGGKRLKVSDTSRLQSSGNLKSQGGIDRFSRLRRNNQSHGGGYGSQVQQNFQYAKSDLYNDYEAMDTDSILSSALDIYADETTMKNEFGDVLLIRSQKEDIQKVIHNLFYDVLNIEFNLWPWVRNLCKYGDFFLKLDIAEKYGIVNVVPLSPYEIWREEGYDPENPYSSRFTQDGVGGKEQYESFEIAHFRLLSDTNFLPYGRAMIEPARKTWKQLIMMEDAMMIHRIMRAPEKRMFNIDVGNIPPDEVDGYMQAIIDKMKKVPFTDSTTGEYNLKFNIQNMMEDFYLPTRGGESGTRIESLAGLEFNAIDDIEYLKNKMMSALRVPKAFLGYEEGIEGKATLAAEDIRFARTIERIQRIVVSELTKIAIVHLYTQGYTDDDLINFELALTTPSTVYEQEKVSLWQEKIRLISDMQGSKIISNEWMYENILNMSKEQWEREQVGVVKDLQQAFRHSQIEQEGNDPAKSHQSFGTPHDLASLGKDHNKDDDPAENPVGRPDIGNSYASTKHYGGQDPLGNKDLSKTFRDPSPLKHNFRGNSPLKREQYSKDSVGMKTLVQSLNGRIKTRNIIKETLEDKPSSDSDKGTILDENNLMDM